MDARHTKKHGKSRFGDKLSLSVDIKHGLIRNIATGTASEHVFAGIRHLGASSSAP